MGFEYNLHMKINTWEKVTFSYLVNYILFSSVDFSGRLQYAPLP